MLVMSPFIDDGFLRDLSACDAPLQLVSRKARRAGTRGSEMIRLKAIQINRFRGIREENVHDFADVNLLVGRNNSGKSTVVEAIHRVAYSIVNTADPIGPKPPLPNVSRISALRGRPQHGG